MTLTSAYSLLSAAAVFLAAWLVASIPVGVAVGCRLKAMGRGAGVPIEADVCRPRARVKS